MTGLELRDVRKAFGAQPVLTGVNLTVEAGSFTAILGASGSGKTTLLRILAGFEHADAGVVCIGDLVVDDGRRHVAPERRRIGYVPQEGALFPHLTVSANVAFGLSRAARRTGRVGELLDLVGLADLGRRFPHELSGGQQQRVAVARALAINPSLVLLDEPFSSLDAALRASVRADVGRVLRTAGATALLVTHDQDEALSMADRVAVLRDGVIAQVGAPKEVYERPADLALAHFLGEANVFAGVAADGIATIPIGAVAIDGINVNSDGITSDGTTSAGGDVVVMVRPEQITIATGTPPGAPGVHGRVEELHYFGHDTVLLVRLDGADVVRVRVVGTQHVAPGQAVTVSATGRASAWCATG